MRSGVNAFTLPESMMRDPKGSEQSSSWTCCLQNGCCVEDEHKLAHTIKAAAVGRKHAGREQQRVARQKREENQTRPTNTTRKSGV